MIRADSVSSSISDSSFAFLAVARRAYKDIEFSNMILLMYDTYLPGGHPPQFPNRSYAVEHPTQFGMVRILYTHEPEPCGVYGSSHRASSWWNIMDRLGSNPMARSAASISRHPMTGACAPTAVVEPQAAGNC